MVINNKHISERIKFLETLIQFQDGWESCQNELSKFQWDSKNELVVLTVENIIAVLRKNKEVQNYEALERWANLIESREDIGFEKPKVKEVIENIANPVLYGNLTDQKIDLLISILN